MRVLAQDLQFPEGPVALPDGSVLVVEIRRKTLARCWPDGRTTIVANLGGGPNGAAMGADGYCYVVNNGGFAFTQRADGRWVTTGTPDDYVTGRIERVDIETGNCEVLYDKIGTHAIRGPNDLVMDAHGGFWFTDPGKTRHRDWDRGSICYARCDGSLVREMVFPIHKPNGIGLSPDGTTLYVAETETARLWAWDLKGPGELARPATASHTSPHGSRLVYASSVYQRFDSLAVEASGNICVATLDRGGITVIDPSTNTAEFVEVPGDTHCTNLCFGGKDLRKAYVTQSYAGRLIEIDWPRAGLPLNDRALAAAVSA
ncbi:MAG TPA: SMP-30/gluconolactonase/LRE family protein [Casimicrobiaceae bacterium]|nr:SMP-30/gluconolactonase/LRE family protein [Casimicrobiaceae bacterium]